MEEYYDKYFNKSQAEGMTNENPYIFKSFSFTMDVYSGCCAR